MKNHSGFGIVLIDEGKEVGPVAIPFPFGTLVEIVDWDNDESGLLMIVTRGVEKFRTIETRVTGMGLLVGDVELLGREPKTPIPADLKETANLLQRAVENMEPLLDLDQPDFTDAVWVSHRLVELLPMSAKRRHDMVALDDPIERLRALQTYMSQQK